MSVPGSVCCVQWKENSCLVQADPEVRKNAVLWWEKEPEGRLEGVGAGLGASRPRDPPAWLDDLQSWRPAMPAASGAHYKYAEGSDFLADQKSVPYCGCISGAACLSPSVIRGPAPVKAHLRSSLLRASPAS